MADVWITGTSSEEAKPLDWHLVIRSLLNSLNCNTQNMPTPGLSIAEMLLGIIVVLVVAAVHADTNVTLSDAGSMVSIRDHEVQVIPYLGDSTTITTTWSLADPTFPYNNDQLRSHPGRVTIGYSGGLLTIANSSDDSYVQNLRIHYGQAEELYNATAATSRSPRLDLEIADDGLSGLMNLSALTLVGINFSSPDVTLVLPDTISFIEISATTAEDISFDVPDISALQEIVLLNNAFTALPKFFYERKYPQEQLNITLQLTLPISMELPDEYFENLKANIDKFTGWVYYVSLHDSCSNVSDNSNSVTTSVCNNGEAVPVESGSSGSSVGAASGSNAARKHNSGSITVGLAVTIVVAAISMV